MAAFSGDRHVPVITVAIGCPTSYLPQKRTHASRCVTILSEWIHTMFRSAHSSCVCVCVLSSWRKRLGCLGCWLLWALRDVLCSVQAAGRGQMFTIYWRKQEVNVCGGDDRVFIINTSFCVWCVLSNNPISAIQPMTLSAHSDWHGCTYDLWWPDQEWQDNWIMVWLLIQKAALCMNSPRAGKRCYDFCTDCNYKSQIHNASWGEESNADDPKLLRILIIYIHIWQRFPDDLNHWLSVTSMTWPVFLTVNNKLSPG